MNNCTLFDNVSESNQPMIYIIDTNMVMNHCTLSGNRLNSWVMYAESYDGTSTVELNNTLIANNETHGYSTLVANRTGTFTGCNNFIESTTSFQNGVDGNIVGEFAFLGIPTQSENGQWYVPLLPNSRAKKAMDLHNYRNCFTFFLRFGGGRHV